MAVRSPERTPLLSRLWFPGALALLALVAIPGLMLLLAHLFGYENDLNGWLRDRLGLSYHLAVPPWAALVLVVLPVLLVLLYFLKLKRQPVAVPSTYLWRKSIEDLQVNSLFQWLRRNLLLLIQLLTLLLLLYAVLSLQLFANLSSGRRYIILIDNSASMGATDVAPSRLHQARAEALKEIDAYSDSDSGMVIEFNSRARVVQTFTTDRNLLRRAVNQIEQTQRPTRIDEALLQADGRANPTRTADDQASRPAGEDPEKARTYVSAEGASTEVHLFSDGGFPDVSDFALGNLQMHYHAIGVQGAEHVNNLAVVTLTAERDPNDRQLLNVFGRVRNFGPKTVKASIQLDVEVDGVLQPGLREKPLNETGEVPPRTVIKPPPGSDEPIQDEPGEGLFTFQIPGIAELASVILHARLVKHKDALPLDDEAYLAVGVVRQARVLIVGNGKNQFLEAFFEEAANQKIVSLTYLEAGDLKDDRKYTLRAQQGAWDLVVFDRCAPEKAEDMPFANTFFIDALPPPWKRAEMPTMKYPRVRGWATRHPLMRGLTGLQDIDIAEAFQFNLKDPRVPVRTPRLLEIDRENAVLFTLPRRSFTDLIMTFPLLNDKGQWNTFWPLKISFLLFLRNVVFTLGNVRGDESLQPGQLKLIYPDTPVTQIQVVDPAGKTHTLDRGARSFFSFDHTDRIGVYPILWGGSRQRVFTVNLFDSQESNLEPRQEFQIGAEKVVMDKARRQPHDLWKIVAVVAVGLLLLEWYLYNQRILF